MKTKILTAACSMVLFCGGVAMADDMKTDKVAARSMHGDGHMQMLASTFGAHVKPLDRSLAEANKVSPGVGLVVDMVTPDSVAAKSGLMAKDVIVRLDDQWVINDAQLCTLLSIQKPDDEFDLHVYRNGEAKEVDVKLSQDFINDMRKQHDAMAGSGASMGEKPLIIPESFAKKDDVHDIVIDRGDVGPKLLVKDSKTGDVLFEGPFGTPADRAKVPADIREKVVRLLNEYVAKKAS